MSSSSSPPLRRLSSTNSSSKESLINAYEAEEERIINILSRKLEQLREEKVELENALEAESESHVNRLSREISALRLAQQQAVNGNRLGSGSLSPVETRIPLGAVNPLEPTTEVMLEAMRRENEQLRNRLTETERDYIRISRLNDIYREELIDHRRRVGLPVDNLIGLAPSAIDPYSQPIHRRASTTSSPYPVPQSLTTQSARVPIPRPPSQIHRPSQVPASVSISTTPPSSGSLSSPFIFSPPSGSMSAATNLTTPASSDSQGSFTGGPETLPRALELTYPSVPPPSLSSSFGDPLSMESPLLSPINGSQTAPAPMSIPRPIRRRGDRDISVSPVDTFNMAGARGPSLSPRASFHLARKASFERAWANDNVSPVRNRSRVRSTERGARVAETGTLVPAPRTSGSIRDTPVNGTTVTADERSIETVESASRASL